MPYTTAISAPATGNRIRMVSKYGILLWLRPWETEIRKQTDQYQRTEQNDFSPHDPDYGGWDLAGGSGLRGQSTGTNISITCFALEALQTADDEAARHAKTLAIAW